MSDNDGDAADAPGEPPEDPDAYRTLAGRGRAEFTVNGSEFIGHAAPAGGVEAAEDFVTEIREAFPDATHNVPAYRVNADPFREYSSDDGEPSGSAGKPILNVLQGREVEDAVVVVTRYYGGTNLGVGGLVRSYSRAAKEAITDAGVTWTRPHERLVATVDYDDSGTVRGVLESAGVEFDASYEAAVRFDARVPTREATALRDRLLSATSGRVDLE
ncbi:IMPACT family protein [Haloglomus litoreum]|uniref:IMPACT family protein n=1 Tax=Haloglomus litoreum TaxID=3034026 RepID=UPI0023E870DC|nr:YigZ family protein [Haloglomus sp. DT116]